MEIRQLEHWDFGLVRGGQFCGTSGWEAPTLGLKSSLLCGTGGLAGPILGLGSNPSSITYRPFSAKCRTNVAQSRSISVKYVG